MHVYRRESPKDPEQHERHLRGDGGEEESQETEREQACITLALGYIKMNTSMRMASWHLWDKEQCAPRTSGAHVKLADAPRPQ